MPQKRKSMYQIRKILELHLGLDSMSIRTIAIATRVSRPVVKNYIDLCRNHKLELETIRNLSDTELAQHLGLSQCWS